GGLVGQIVEEVGAAGEGAGPESFGPEHYQQGVADGVIVVDDEDRVPVHACSSSASRCSRKEKAAPPRSLRRTSSLPPWLSTMERVTDRPRPIPPLLVVIIGWKMLSIWSSGMPGPLSSTEIS